MEESSEDIIYDLEESANTEPEATQEESVLPDIGTGISTDSESDNDNGSACGAAVRMTALHDADLNEEEGKKTSPRKEIERMVEEMGAATLLEIIRDNRNAAIRQIIKEVEATQRHDLPSGNSAARTCGSIFDLAALA